MEFDQKNLRPDDEISHSKTSSTALATTKVKSFKPKDEDLLISSHEPPSKENAKDFVLGDVCSPKEEIAQIKAFSEQLYDQALQLRMELLEGENPDILAMAVQTNLRRFKEHLQKFQNNLKVLNQSLSVRESDELEDLEILQEMIEGLIAIRKIEDQKKQGQKVTIKMPDMAKVYAKREKLKERAKERAEKAIEDTKERAKENARRSEILEIMMEELRRAKKKQEEKIRQEFWNIYKKKIKVAVLVVLLGIIPLAYLTLGVFGENSKISVNVYDYRKEIEMSKAYEKDRIFYGIVENRWQKLYPKEKTLQINKLAKRLGNRIMGIEIIDQKGELLAEYRRKEVILY